MIREKLKSTQIHSLWSSNNTRITSSPWGGPENWTLNLWRALYREIERLEQDSVRWKSPSLRTDKMRKNCILNLKSQISLGLCTQSCAVLIFLDQKTTAIPWMCLSALLSLNKLELEYDSANSLKHPHRRSIGLAILKLFIITLKSAETRSWSTTSAVFSLTT